MKNKSSGRGTALVIIAGMFWGSMGLFVRALGDHGFSSMQVACMRLTASAIIMALVMLFREPAGFRLKRRDIPLFLALGLLSVLFFSVCYFMAIELMTLSAAAILLYTSPIWVMLLSLVIFKEKFSLKKLLALLLAFAGCALVSGIGGGGLTPLGVLVGLCAGVGYAFYSIFSSLAINRGYSPIAVTTYTFIISAAGSWFLCRPGEMLAIVGAAESPGMLLLLIVITALVTAVIPFMCYSLGLKTVEPSRAAILATVEPVVASALGVIVYHEALTLPAIIGIVLVLSAIVILSIKKK